MGKVYDALRRAEEQRTQRTGTPGEPAASPTWTAGRGALVDRASTLKRWAARHRHRYTEDGGTFNKRRIALLQPGSFAAEQFRTLRARIDSLAADRPLRTIAVTSALAGEGKTLAAVNLAIVSSMSVDRRVLLVDCDLRKPKIHASLGLRPEAGLAEVLKGEAPLDKAILRVEGVNLDVLPARNHPTNPSELLASEAMKKLVEELVARYHRVVFDTPATLALPDAKAVSELSDGVVLVVRAETSPQEDVQAALDVLDRRRVIGLVLNGAAVDPERYGY
jgi:capsular exopolysaccharide synthesis family protein